MDKEFIEKNIIRILFRNDANSYIYEHYEESNACCYCYFFLLFFFSSRLI